MPGLTWVEEMFENLHPDDYYKSSEATSDYNCAAFAGGDMTRWWQPLYYWHPKAVLSSHYGALESQYYHEGDYVRCEDGELEVGYEKIAIYASRMEDWRHAARLGPDGWWESKLGRGEDIRHRTVECLEGVEYGNVIQYLRRRADGDTEGQMNQTNNKTNTENGHEM